MYEFLMTPGIETYIVIACVGAALFTQLRVWRWPGAVLGFLQAGVRGSRLLGGDPGLSQVLVRLLLLVIFVSLCATIPWFLPVLIAGYIIKRVL